MSQEIREIKMVVACPKNRLGDLVIALTELGYTRPVGFEITKEIDLTPISVPKPLLKVSNTPRGRHGSRKGFTAEQVAFFQSKINKREPGVPLRVIAEELGISLSTVT